MRSLLTFGMLLVGIQVHAQLPEYTDKNGYPLINPLVERIETESDFEVKKDLAERLEQDCHSSFLKAGGDKVPLEYVDADGACEFFKSDEAISYKNFDLRRCDDYILHMAGSLGMPEPSQIKFGTIKRQSMEALAFRILASLGCSVPANMISPKWQKAPSRKPQGTTNKAKSSAPSDKVVTPKADKAKSPK